MSNYTIPKLSHLQFAVLEVLLRVRDGKKTTMIGEEVRIALGKVGIDRKGPAFFQLMRRLEAAKLVESDYRIHLKRGDEIKKRHYEITDEGIRALNETRQFYDGRTNA